MTADEIAKMVNSLFAGLQATLEKRDAEYKAEQAERQAERDRTYKAEQAERDRKHKAEMKEISRNLGGLGNSVGLLGESLFCGLWRQFSPLGFGFDGEAHRVAFRGAGGVVLAEVDYYLENGNYVLAVEVKTRLNAEAVVNYIERLTKLRKVMDGRKDGRKLMGALACGIVNSEAVEFAHKKGLHVVAQSGDSIELAERPSDFVARQWVSEQTQG